MRYPEIISAYTQWKLYRAAYFYRLLHKLFLPKSYKLRAEVAQVSKRCNNLTWTTAKGNLNNRKLGKVCNNLGLTPLGTLLTNQASAVTNFTNVPPTLLCIRIDVCSAWTLEFLLHSQLFSSKSMQQRLNYFLTILLFYSIPQFSKLRGRGQGLSALQNQVSRLFLAIHPFTSGTLDI